MNLLELQAIARKIVEAKAGEFEDKVFEATDYHKEISAMPPRVHKARFTTHDFGRQKLTINKVEAALWIIRCRDTGIRDLDDFQVFESEDGILFVHDWRVGFFQPPDFHIYM